MHSAPSIADRSDDGDVHDDFSINDSSMSLVVGNTDVVLETPNNIDVADGITVTTNIGVVPNDVIAPLPTPWWSWPGARTRSGGRTGRVRSHPTGRRAGR